MKKAGKVYFVGAGPGEPGLLTLKGLDYLKRSDVIIYDYLVNPKLLEFAKPEAEKIRCDQVSGVQFRDGFIVHQEKINQLMVKKAKLGKTVCRFKNGDVMIFSRLSQELEALNKYKILFELVPGVTAASAAAGFSGIPLTDRRYASVLSLITGHEDPKKENTNIAWDKLSPQSTLVFYMAVENLAKIVKRLLNNSFPKNLPVAIIENATLYNQKITTGILANIVRLAKKFKVHPPAMIVVGKVVSLRKSFDWLRGKKIILYTGINLDPNLEGIILHQPMIKIMPLRNFKTLDNEIKRITDYDFIIFNSRFGVKHFLERLLALGYDTRSLLAIKLCAIGKTTASELLNYRLKADVVAQNESSQGLINALKNSDLENKHILITASNLSGTEEKTALEKSGAKVTQVITYLNIAPKVEKIDLNFIDEIYFLSPSGINNFLKVHKTIPERVKIKCIGQTTLGYLKEKGFKGDIFKG